MPYFESENLTDKKVEEANNKWITKSFNPNVYNLKLSSDRNKELNLNDIEIWCGSDELGPYIQYRLFGNNKIEISGVIRQQEIADLIIPNSAKEICHSDKPWLSAILAVTSKRGHTNPNRIPPTPEIGPFRPYQQPKGNLVFDNKRKMYFYKETDTSSLKSLGLFAVKTAIVIAAAYAAYQEFKPK